MIRSSTPVFLDSATWTAAQAAVAGNSRWFIADNWNETPASCRFTVKYVSTNFLDAYYTFIRMTTSGGSGLILALGTGAGGIVPSIGQTLTLTNPISVRIWMNQ